MAEQMSSSDERVERELKLLQTALASSDLFQKLVLVFFPHLNPNSQPLNPQPLTPEPSTPQAGTPSP